MLTVRGSITTPTTKVINITPLFPGRDIGEAVNSQEGADNIPRQQYDIFQLITPPIIHSFYSVLTASPSRWR